MSIMYHSLEQSPHFSPSLPPSHPPSLSLSNTFFSDGCFVEATSECGNSVNDPGEECDCGSQGDTATGDCPTDQCCNATSCLSSTDVECRYKSIVYLHKDWSLQSSWQL